MTASRSLRSACAVLLAAAAVTLGGCMVAAPPAAPGVTHLPGAAPGVYETSAEAWYKPVPVPGTQRRVAQGEAEAKARRQVLEYVGSLPAGASGQETVNQVMNRDPQLRAKILEFVRTSKVADWIVDPCAGRVQVIVRADLAHLRAILASYGC